MYGTVNCALVVCGFILRLEMQFIQAHKTGFLLLSKHSNIEHPIGLLHTKFYQR